MSKIKDLKLPNIGKILKNVRDRNSKLPVYLAYAGGVANKFSWILSGASLDFDFANNRYFQQGVTSMTAPITVSRASVGYVDDSYGNWVPVPANTARRSDKGLLVEEARTNSLRNNSMQGAVAGSPGTLPTNWLATNTAGLTQTVVGKGTENGIDYVDIRFNGTATSTQIILFFEATNQIAALQNQIWTGSAFYRLSSGTTTNVSNIELDVLERDSGGAGLSTGSNTGTLTSSSQRLITTYTLPTVSAAFVVSRIVVNLTTTAATDFTIRIGWPQLELGAFVTSPIRTTSAAVTRAADAPTVTTQPVFTNSWSLFCQMNPNGITTSTLSRSFLNATTLNAFAVQLWIWDTNDPTHFRATNAVTSSILFSGSPNSDYKGAIAQSGTTDFAASANGSVSTGSSGTGLTPTNVYIGVFGSGGGQANGFIKRIAVWPTTRIPNATLIALTA